MENFDVIIIGGGPAGASTALYTARGGLDTLVVHNCASALLKAERIQNFYGAGEVSGAELYNRGLAQAADVGAVVLDAQVTFARFDGERFTVSTTAGEYSAKKLVIATGSARRTADIPGLSDYEGRGVSYCAVCDAFFCRNKRVGVIGAGEFAAHEYATVAAVAKEAYLLTNGEAPCFDVPEDMVIGKRVAKISGGDNGRVNGVVFDDGSILELDAVFVALGVLSSAGIAKSMGVFTDGGAIVTDGRGMTNIPGLFAAGDCTAGIKQVGKAVADGVTVGMSVVSELRSGK